MADEDVPLSFLNKEDYPIEYAYAPQPDLSQYTWLNVEAYQHYVRGNKVGRMVQVGHILPGLRKSIGKMCKVSAGMGFMGFADFGNSFEQKANLLYKSTNFIN
uniref:Uncharacterized protein n=1 Tax=Pyricularia oryzae (strain P131) TaxID=1143193 RepID=L7IRQ5_PYRO1